MLCQFQKRQFAQKRFDNSIINITCSTHCFQRTEGYDDQLMINPNYDDADKDEWRTSRGMICQYEFHKNTPNEEGVFGYCLTIPAFWSLCRRVLVSTRDPSETHTRDQPCGTDPLFLAHGLASSIDVAWQFKRLIEAIIRLPNQLRTD